MKLLNDIIKFPMNSLLKFFDQRTLIENTIKIEIMTVFNIFRLIWYNTYCCIHIAITTLTNYLIRIAQENDNI